MAENLTVEAPEFDEIQRGNRRATADGIRLLWQVINELDRRQRTGLRAAIERWEKKTLTSSPGASQNNFDSQFATVLRFDGAGAINVTGIRARQEGAFVLVLVLGAGTVTLMHQSASSEAANRMVFQAAADKGVTTNRAVLLCYQNLRWREISWI